MRHLPKSIQRLIEELAKLPGIGPKSAGRLAFSLVRRGSEDVRPLGEVILALHEQLKTCSTCFNVAEADPCSICADADRATGTVCVVEHPLDTVAIEKTDFRGRYHVLGGAISPIDGIGPEQLRIRELVTRVETDPEIKELILATNSSLEGEATALYIQKALDEHLPRDRQKTLTVTRIAHGLPVGGDLEYADALTLSRALEGRRSVTA
ncbi:recombination protein RecR [Candidatus Berkelbacteria bacterium]|nr:recombination protein RecR [Candidatus Berkelbacteria bacterium]